MKQVGLRCLCIQKPVNYLHVKEVVLTFNTHPFNGPLSRTVRVGRYQKGKTNLDFTEARDSEWQ